MAPDPISITGYDSLVEIGRGGFAVVYEARQIRLQRMVAVKVLLGGATEATALARFEQECGAIGSLSGHPHVVAVHDAGTTDDGRPYLAMEYLPEGSLADRLAKGPIPPEDVVMIGAALASALQAAHDTGVLHRDVKPENVLVTSDGTPKLADFGIAVVSDARQTATGVVVGTVHHAAPEVLSGVRASAASDVYSLASTLYALLTGRAAFAGEPGEGPLPAMYRVVNDQAPNLRAKGVPPALAQVIEAAMVKDPNQRTPSAEALRTALSGLSLGQTGTFPGAGDATVLVPSTPTPPPPPPPTPAPGGYTPPPPPPSPSGFEATQVVGSAYVPPAQAAQGQPPQHAPPYMTGQPAGQPFAGQVAGGFTPPPGDGGVGGPPPYPSERGPSDGRGAKVAIAALGAAVVVLLGVIAAVVLLGGDGDDTATEPTASTRPATTPSSSETTTAPTSSSSTTTASTTTSTTEATTTTSTTTTTTQATTTTSTAPSAGDGDQAGVLIRDRYPDFTVTDSSWFRANGAGAVIGQDGSGRQAVFLFGDGELIGRDALEASTQLTVVSASGNDVTIRFDTWSAGASPPTPPNDFTDVTVRWNGDDGFDVVSGDFPPTDVNAEGHR